MAIKLLKITFGCFIPLHSGHLKMIKEAIEYDNKYYDKDEVKTIIGVCGYPCDRGKGFIDFKTRVKLFKKFIKENYPNENIEVVEVNDKELGLTGKFDTESWKIWSKKLLGKYLNDKNIDRYRWFIGEKDYIDKLEEIYPSHYFSRIYRTVDETSGDELSGTKIRENLDYYLEDDNDTIQKVFKDYLLRRKKLKAMINLKDSLTNKLIKLTIYLFVILFIIGFAIAIFKQSYFTVQSGTKKLVFSAGRLTSVANEGLHFKIPYYQTTETVPITTQSIDEVKAEAASSDLQVVTSAITINYHFDKDKLPEIYVQTQFNVEDNIIRPRIQETLKAVCAKYTAENLIVNRVLAKQEIDNILKSDLSRYNIIVEDVQLTNFQFSPEFNRAIEAKQTETQNALKAKNTLERIKIEAEQRVTIANAEAEAIKVKANAEAEAIRIKTEAIRAQGGKEYVQLKWVEKWDGKQPSTVLGDKDSVLMNIK